MKKDKEPLVRTNIYLTEKQVSELTKKSYERGVTRSYIIREAIDKKLGT